jgi:hypothetical protein
MLKIFNISKICIISVKLAQVLTRVLSEYCVAREASSSLLLRKGNPLKNHLPYTALFTFLGGPDLSVVRIGFWGVLLTHYFHRQQPSAGFTFVGWAMLSVSVVM